MRRLKNGSPVMEFKTEEDIHLAKSYFGTLREMIKELNGIRHIMVKDILDKYKIEFIDIDEIPRVGIENPYWRTEAEELEDEGYDSDSHEALMLGKYGEDE